VIENNLFASHMHISLRQPSETTSRFADANYIPYKILDGNDVVTVAQNSKKLIDNLRNGAGPAILELVTYRWYGHVDWREDIDVGVARSMEDIKNWKSRDPIHRLSQSMINSNIWTKEEENELSNKIDREIQIAWEKAMRDDYPSKDEILKHVYSN
jgi:TPP-dependent pyruvate/acetoin dehydrogenase alpha subunit